MQKTNSGWGVLDFFILFKGNKAMGTHVKHNKSAWQYVMCEYVFMFVWMLEGKPRHGQGKGINLVWSQNLLTLLIQLFV